MSIKYSLRSIENDLVLGQKIMDAWKTRQTQIDVSSFNICADSYAKTALLGLGWAINIYWDLGDASYSTIDYNGMVKTLCLEYKLTSTEQNAYNQKVEKELDKIVSEIPELTNSSSTDYDKIKAMYDWLCHNFEYSFDTGGREECYRERKGVCMAYSMLIRDLCKRCNIPVTIIGSAPSNHVWNEVFIDNDWYAIDATWGHNGPDNDPNYDFFLISDATMQLRGHSGDIHGAYPVADNFKHRCVKDYMFNNGTLTYTPKDFDFDGDANTELDWELYQTYKDYNIKSTPISKVDT